MYFSLYIAHLTLMATSTSSFSPSSYTTTTLLAMAPQVMEKLKAKVVGVSKKVKKIAMDDPRRITHSLKVGLALTFVSIFYYLNPLYEGFGVNTMWAVLTVVVVMEYTVGGTLSKGLNRAFATLLAGALGIGAHYLAALSGQKGEPILLSCFVFLLAAAATFSRFIPEIKARYDYGVLIFILTFSLVAVSSYRVDEIVELSHQRLSTIAIGGASCIMISICLFPVWAGGDLHDLVALNLEKLATYLEGLASEYFMKMTSEDDTVKQDENCSYLQAYKSVLNTKVTEETLANLARWEPGHGRFGYRHPWQQYLKVGALARQCACCIEALDAHITKSEFQVSSESQRKIQESCYEMSMELSKALKELAMGIRTMTVPSTAETHILTANNVAKNLKLIFVEEDSLSDILHATTVASILTEVVMFTQNITKSTIELSRLAGFKSNVNHPKANTTVRPVSEEEGSNHISITVEK